MISSKNQGTLAIHAVLLISGGKSENGNFTLIEYINFIQQDIPNVVIELKKLYADSYKFILSSMWQSMDVFQGARIAN